MKYMALPVDESFFILAIDLVNALWNDGLTHLK